MTLVVDLGPRYVLLGSAGEDKPSLRVPSYVGFPVSPPGLKFKEVGSMPLSVEEKADHVDAVAILESTSGGLAFNEDALEIFTGFLATRHDSELLLSSPANDDTKFKSKLAECIFEPSSQFRRLLPQNNLVTLAFGCAKVSTVVLDVASSHATIAAVRDGDVLTSHRSTQVCCDEALRNVFGQGDESSFKLNFPYSPTANPFVMKSFIDLCRLDRYYSGHAKLPDGTELRCYPDLGGAISKVLKAEGVTADMAATLVLGGEGSSLASVPLGEAPLHQVVEVGEATHGWRVVKGGESGSWFGGSIVGSLSVYSSAAVEASAWHENGDSLWARRGI